MAEGVELRAKMYERIRGEFVDFFRAPIVNGKVLSRKPDYRFVGNKFQLGVRLKGPVFETFAEFQGASAYPGDFQGSGDVKYHLGTSANRVFDGHPIHLSLAANPSHLEAVDSVVLGNTRAKQSHRADVDRRKVMAVLLHGDAAFAGQGLVAECFGLSELEGYGTGGSIHFIVNNQIGFTTSPAYSRSSHYPSDVAKTVQAPIFHVNGDEPEAVVHVGQTATEFRQAFGRDVVIDMFCYRRYGHNEADDPSFTQPRMYQAIARQPTVRQMCAEKLIAESVVTADEAKRYAAVVPKPARLRFCRCSQLQRWTKPIGWRASGKDCRP